MRHCSLCNEIKEPKEFWVTEQNRFKLHCNTCEPFLPLEEWKAKQKEIHAAEIPERLEKLRELREKTECCVCKCAGNVEWYKSNGEVSLVQRHIENGMPWGKIVMMTSRMTALHVACKPKITLYKEKVPKEVLATLVSGSKKPPTEEETLKRRLSEYYAGYKRQSAMGNSRAAARLKKSYFELRDMLARRGHETENLFAPVR